MNIRHGDLLAAERKQLLQERLAVAHRAGSPPSNDLQRCGLGADAFGRTNVLQPLDDRPHLNRREVEPLAAREYRDRNLVCLGGTEDELHMLRRLLQRLE